MRAANRPQSEIQAFLDTIRANPGDDTTRLVFADWLQEHDDPRAPWVRNAVLWYWMAPDASDPIPRILAAATDPAQRHRFSGAHVSLLLHWIGPDAIQSVRDWVRQSPDERFPHVESYLSDTPPPELGTVVSLMKQIRTGTWYDVYEGVVDLGFHGPKAAPAVDLLLDLPYHDKWEEFSDIFRYNGSPLEAALANTLGEIGSAAMKAVPMLAAAGWHGTLERIKPDPLLVLEHITDSDDGNTSNGLSLVASLDPTKTDALVSAIRNYPGRKRLYAIKHLGEMGESAAHTLPVLADIALTAEEWEQPGIHHFVVRALAAIGDAVKPSVATVVPPSTRTAVINALHVVLSNHENYPITHDEAARTLMGWSAPE